MRKSAGFVSFTALKVRYNMLTDIQLLQIKKNITRILHVPGNYTGGILEMAIVADYHMPAEMLQEDCAAIVGALKKHSEVFRNVRLNLLKWVSDDCIIKEVTPIPYLQMGRAFEDYEKYADKAGMPEGEHGVDAEKSLDELCRQLKLFYARSKVVLMITDGSFVIRDKKAVKEALQPFLYRKLLMLKNDEQIPGVRLFMETADET